MATSALRPASDVLSGAAALRAIFDAEFYSTQSASFTSQGGDALQHYLDVGWREGSDPSALFDGQYYARDNALGSGLDINPLLHFVLTGADEGRSPAPSFDAAWYRARYPDVGEENPLAHYMRVGAAELRWPNPHFDAWAYVEAHPEAWANPLKHFLTDGAFGRAALPAQAQAPLLRLPSGPLDGRAPRKPGKLCVCLCIYDVATADGVASALDNIPVEFDLLVTTDGENKRSALREALRGVERAGRIEVRALHSEANAPLPRALSGRGALAQYEVCLHLGAPSVHQSAGAFSTLLNSPAAVATMLDMFSGDDGLGLIFAADDSSASWAHTLEAARDVMFALELPLTREHIAAPSFPVGLSCWLRPRAIAPLLEAEAALRKIQGHDMSRIAGAVERLGPAVARARGYESRAVSTMSDLALPDPAPAFAAARKGPAYSTRFGDFLSRAPRRRQFREWDHPREQQFRAAIDAAYLAIAPRVDALEACVILPVFNRAKSVGAAIESVLAQTHERIQLVVVDDGSTDRTPKVLNRFRADQRVNVIRQENGGVSSARNAGLRQARAPYVFYLDSDNTWGRDYLRTMLTFMETGELDVAYAGLKVNGNDDGKVFYRGDEFSWRACLASNYVDLNIFAHRRACVEHPLIRFDERLKRLVDWDFILRVTASGRIAFAPFVGADYYNGADGERISRTIYVDGALDAMIALVKDKNAAAPDAPDNVDVRHARRLCAPGVSGAERR